MDLVPATRDDKPALLALNEYYTYDFSELLGLDALKRREVRQLVREGQHVLSHGRRWEHASENFSPLEDRVARAELRVFDAAEAALPEARAERKAGASWAVAGAGEDPDRPHARAELSRERGCPT